MSMGVGVGMLRAGLRGCDEGVGVEEPDGAVVRCGDDGGGADDGGQEEAWG